MNKVTILLVVLLIATFCVSYTLAGASPCNSEVAANRGGNGRISSVTALDFEEDPTTNALYDEDDGLTLYDEVTDEASDEALFSDDSDLTDVEAQEVEDVEEEYETSSDEE